MPRVNSQMCSRGVIKTHFNRYGFAYTMISAVAAVFTGAGVFSYSLDAKEEKRQRMYERAREDERSVLRAAFDRGEKTIVFESGNTYSILSRLSPDGDTVLTAHKAIAMSPGGEITAIEPDPRIIVIIAAPTPTTLLSSPK